MYRFKCFTSWCRPERRCWVCQGKVKPIFSYEMLMPNMFEFDGVKHGITVEMREPFFDPVTQSWQQPLDSPAEIARDIALTFARDREGKIRSHLIELGWSPPGLPSTDESLGRVGAVLSELRREKILTQADSDLIYERVRDALQKPPQS